jgi:hypothetical protein
MRGKYIYRSKTPTIRKQNVVSGPNGRRVKVGQMLIHITGHHVI